MSQFLEDVTFTTPDNLTCTAEDEEKNEVLLLQVSIGAMVSIYVLLLSLLIHNVVQYVIRQGRYKTFHISFFYLLSFAVLSLRIVFFSMAGKFLGEHTAGVVNEPGQNLDNVDNFATYTEMILGTQQLCSMIELNLMIRWSTLYKVCHRGDEDLLERKVATFKKMKMIRYATVLASVLLMAVCAYLTYFAGSRLSDDPQKFVLTTSICFLAVSALLLV